MLYVVLSTTIDILLYVILSTVIDILYVILSIANDIVTDQVKLVKRLSLRQEHSQLYLIQFIRQS